MPLLSLLLSRDDQVIKFFCRVLNDLGIEVEVCADPERAQQELLRRKFDAVVIDCDDVLGGPEVLKSVRRSPCNRSSTAFALIHGVTSVREAFAMGANLTLEKPISLDRVRNSFRAAHGLIMLERRRYFRFPLDIPVTLKIEGKEMQAQATNLSEGGMGVQLKTPVPAGKTLVGVRFALPGAPALLAVNCTVCWADERGNLGLRFESPAHAMREQLERWIGKQMEVEKQGKRPVALVR